VTQRVDEIVRDTPGVQHTIAVPGYSVLTATNVSNVGDVRHSHRSRNASCPAPADVVIADLRQKFQKVQDAIVVAVRAPPVMGLRSTGGLAAGAGPCRRRLRGAPGAVENVIWGGEAQQGLVGLFSSFRASQPQLYVDIDRTKAKALGVALDDVFATLQVLLGSAYVNDFTPLRSQLAGERRRTRRSAYDRRTSGLKVRSWTARWSRWRRCSPCTTSRVPPS
jgi:multidrug efflux pump